MTDRDGPLRPISQVAREAAARERHERGGYQGRERNDTPVDISCYVRQLAVWDGTSMQDRADRRTGIIRPQEKWVFLPMSLLGPLTLPGHGEPAIIPIPEWLAKDRGLI